MEVHHHAHHGGKKNWRSYLWEFLMLFLAVFCGFMAEWRLEQMIEHHREKEYIESIVEDISADVEQTDELVIDINNRINKVDSLLVALSSNDVQSNSSKTYQLWLASLGFPDFAQNDRTIQQLKSSGSLRIIRNKPVSDKIMDYDQAVRLLSVSQNNMNTTAINNSLFYQMFDFIQLNKTNAINAIPLTDIGKKSLNEAYANRLFWRTNLIGLKKRLTLLNKSGKEITEFIKAQYGLK